MIINTVVVLNYNDWKTTKQLIENIKDYNSIDKIVIVDNASTDDSYEQLKMLISDKISLVKSSENGGYASGNEIGCRYAIEKFNTKYITIANPDVVFSDDTMEKMIEGTNSLEKCGMVGCMMRCHSGIDLPSAWKLPKYKDCILEQLMILRKLVGDSTRYLKEELTSEIVKVEVLPGSFFMISSEAFVKCGGFDTNTFLYYEENIMASKMIQKEYVNYLFTKLSYDHYHSVSINNTFSSKKKRFQIARDSRVYYMENYLRIGKIARCFASITYHVGLFDYLVCDWIRNILNNLRNKKEKA